MKNLTDRNDDQNLRFLFNRIENATMIEWFSVYYNFYSYP